MPLILSARMVVHDATVALCTSAAFTIVCQECVPVRLLLSHVSSLHQFMLSIRKLTDKVIVEPDWLQGKRLC